LAYGASECLKYDNEMSRVVDAIEYSSVADDNNATNAPPMSASLFPAGSYSFLTALTSMSTACSTNADAFRCYPYSLYSASSPDAGAAKFTWIITPQNSTNYVISAAPNPFATQFTNITMWMLDQGQSSERLTFNFTMALQSIPAVPLVTNSAATAVCWYNSTVMTATLWTRQRATYPANITSVPAPVNATNTFEPWPYAVDIREVQDAGPGVPDCRSLAGQPIGNFEVQSASNADICSCSYANFQLAANSSSTTNPSKREVLGGEGE
jgi:hypothetical protein